MKNTNKLEVCLALSFVLGCGGHTAVTDAGSGGQGGQGTGAGGSGGAIGSGGAVGSGGAGGAVSAGGSGGSGGSGTGMGGGAGGGTGGARPDAGTDAGAGAGGRGGAGGAAGAAGGAGGGAAGGAAGNSCATPPPASELSGWATQNGGTDGGGSVTPTVVSTMADLTAAIGGTTMRVVYVMGSFSGTFSIGSNKTIVGLCGAKLMGHVSLSRSANVIVRNLTIQGNNCTDSPNDCSAGADAVTIGDGSHNVWFDHDDVYDGSDGNLDITSGADFVTISWTKFHYSTRRTDPMAGASGHRFSNLIGSADTTTSDAGHLNVTWHHDWWADNVDQRMPRTRFGNIHVFNNLFTAAGNSYCTNAGIQTHVLVENNAYIGVNRPLAPDANGDMLARGNLFQNTTGTNTATGTGFMPPYTYTLDATTNLAASVMSGAGPH